MKTYDDAIEKLQQLSEPLLQEVVDFMDFVIHKHQTKMDENSSEKPSEEAWSQWFEQVDLLRVIPNEIPTSDYQRLLLSKYRQQGLEL